MQLVDNVKTVLGTAPANYTGAASETDIVSLKNYDRVKFTIIAGAWAGGTPAVTLKQCQDVADTGVKALSFSYYYLTVAATAARTKTAVTSDTFNLAATANNIYEIEVRSEDLDVDNGFDCVHLNIASPGANDDFYCVMIELYGGDSVSKSPIVD